MIKKIFCTVLCLFVLLSTVAAESVYNGEFLTDSYTLFYAQSIGGNTAPPGTVCQSPLGGKTQLSFCFTPSGDGQLNLTVAPLGGSGKRTAVSFILSGGSAYSLTAVNAKGKSTLISDKIYDGKTYRAVVELDLKNAVCNTAIYEGEGKSVITAYRHAVELGIEKGVYGFKGVEGDVGAMSISDFAVRRERLAVQSPVLDVANSVVTVGINLTDAISTGDGFDVYAAFYSDDRSVLADVETKHFTYTGTDGYFEAVFDLDDNFKSKCPVSFYAFKSGDITPLTPSTHTANGINHSGCIAHTDFESGEQFKDAPNTVGGKMPLGWYANGWGGAGAPYDITIDGCASLGAPQSGFFGICTPYAPLTDNGMRISLAVKKSSDYTGTFARVVLLYFGSDGGYISSEQKTFKNISADNWNFETVCVSPEDYPENAAKISVAFCSGTAAASGRLYYDSCCVDSLVFNMKCTDELSWIKAGTQVCYVPKYPLNDKIAYICGTVYNSDGTLADEVTASADEVKSNGWRYTPQDSGFYKVTFRAQTSDGTVITEHSDYKAYYEQKTGTVHRIDRAGHSFFVSGFESKGMGDRNPLYGMSIGNYDGRYDLGIADRLGMSFVRLHALSWKDIEPENVTDENGKSYDWGKYDKIFDAIRNKYPLDVIGNILYTPKWASPSDDESGSLVPEYASYAPTKTEYLTEFINDLYDRYGDCVSTWEIYNEPHLPGGSVFWHDTAANYVKMLSGAYGALKTLSGGSDTVTMGGIGAKRYLSFYREFIKNGGWQYTDKLVMHGYDLDPWNYLGINDKMGETSSKGVMDTEAHMVLFNGSSPNICYTEKQLALRMYNEYLRQIKYGVEKIAFFQPYDNSVQAEDLMILDSISSDRNVVSAGLFRKKPDFEPRFAAGALNTLIAMTGKEVHYGDEFKAGGVNIVKLISDGEPLYVLWGDDLTPQQSTALGTFAEGTVITDWEGRSINTADFTVRADEVYFVKNCGGAFDALQSAKGSDVYNGGVVYSENEINKKTAAGAQAVATDGEIFSHSTGSLGAKLLWNDLKYANGKNLNAKFAVTSCSDGFDCVVRTDKDSTLPSATLVLGADTFANGIASDVVEITAEIKNGTCTVKKTASPDLGGDLPSGDYSKKGEAVNGAVCKTFGDDTYKYTCLHIPYTQLYPYFYTQDGSLNFALKFTALSPSGTVSATYFSADGYSPYKPWNFGTVRFGGRANVSKALQIQLVTEPGEYTAVQILRDNEPVYFNQYASDSDGNCNITASLDEDGEYKIKTYNNSSNYGELEFSYTK